ncbi:MAG: ferritin-like domain-containing protein [Wenzhouxiangella sp.]
MTEPASTHPEHNLGAFLAHAVVLEDEAAERYDELADAMDNHNNAEVAALFRKMAGYSRLHRAEAVDHARQHAGGLPPLKSWEFHWPDDESPESANLTLSHYLMTPHQALELALQAECSARDFYAGVAERSELPAIVELAREFAEEEGEHAEALEVWLKRFPKTQDDWDHDPDPPAAAD